MSNGKFTDDDLKALLDISSNKYLKKTAEEKYADFSKVDPFPDVSDALLNSTDITKYVLTTGMIDPFCAKNLSGATYTCEFSGEYIFWDANKIKHKQTLSKDAELPIKPNSIIFLGIKPMFNIPEYMVLRFNLRVKNAYKGLLLGTGPIIDPGYTGKLFIPLHNLTSNEYCIKNDATLIDIEFTKLSYNDKWDLKNYSKLESIVNPLDFSNVSYIPKLFPEKRDTMEKYSGYIDESLVNDPDFFKKNRDTPFISSSIEEEIRKTKKIQKSTENKMEETENKIKELDHLKGLLTITICTVIFAAVTLFVATHSYFHNAREIPETIKKLEEQQKTIKQQKNYLDILENRIQMLENGNK
ncbi:MAG: hypothetical protein LBH43_01895 [Treponema sp.]|jgi:deoxycytidine triphosphate deaminase|nr:hypothetical protein [Treponema sp.]